MRIGWFMEFLPLGAIRPLERAACAITHAECAGVSGPGYYATGPQRDVRDVPVKMQSSFASLDRAETARPGPPVTWVTVKPSPGSSRTASPGSATGPSSACPTGRPETGGPSQPSWAWSSPGDPDDMVTVLGKPYVAIPAAMRRRCRWRPGDVRAHTGRLLTRRACRLRSLAQERSATTYTIRILVLDAADPYCPDLRAGIALLARCRGAQGPRLEQRGSLWSYIMIKRQGSAVRHGSDELCQ